MLREAGTPISTARLSKPAFGWAFWQGRYSPVRHRVISVDWSWFPHPSLSSRSALSIVAKRRLHQRKRVDRQTSPQPEGCTPTHKRSRREWRSRMGPVGVMSHGNLLVAHLG